MGWTTPGTAVAGDVLTAAFWNEQVRDNSNALYGAVRRLAIQTRTTSYAVNQTSIASAADVFSSDLTFTADGTSTYMLEFHCRAAETGTTANSLVAGYLVSGTGTNLNEIFAVGYSSDGYTTISQINAKMFLTPSAGSVSYNIRAIYGTSAGNLYTQSSGAGVMYLAAYGPILT